MKGKMTRRLILFGSLLLLACVAEVDEDLEAEENASGDEQISWRADSADNLSSCKWRRTSNGHDLNVTCQEGEVAIAGGCRTVNGGQIRDMHPYEAASPGNLYEYGDFWYNAAGDQGGWRCSWDTSSADNYVLALCCGP